MNTPPTPRISRRAFAHALTVLSLVALSTALIAGCRGGNRDSVGKEQPSRATDNVSGEWTATLNPDMVEQGVAPLNVPLSLRTGQSNAGTVNLTGSIAGASISDASLRTGGAEPTLRFTTGAITAEGPTGEMTVEGPLTWTATLQNNQLFGEVAGADGRTARWTATKN